jgi:hypothetical protein
MLGSCRGRLEGRRPTTEPQICVGVLLSNRFPTASSQRAFLSRPGSTSTKPRVRQSGTRIGMQQPAAAEDRRECKSIRPMLTTPDPPRTLSIALFARRAVYHLQNPRDGTRTRPNASIVQPTWAKRHGRIAATPNAVEHEHSVDAVATSWTASSKARRCRSERCVQRAEHQRSDNTAPDAGSFAREARSCLDRRRCVPANVERAGKKPRSSSDKGVDEIPQSGRPVHRARLFIHYYPAGPSAFSGSFSELDITDYNVELSDDAYNLPTINVCISARIVATRFAAMMTSTCAKGSHRKTNL